MELVNKKHRALGTVINLSIAPTDPINVLEPTVRMIDEFEDHLTVNRQDSEVMEINHQAGKRAVRVSETTYRLIQQAVEVSKWQLGFNVAIGPLVKLWKIGFDGANKPSDRQIAERLALTDPRAIVLNDQEQSVFLEKEGMELDLGGIAKGFIADEIKDFWQKQHVSSGIIDLGGNVLLVGGSQHPDAKWNVGVQNPVKPRHVPLGVLHIDEKSVGTSGIYERKLVVDGQTYHHMFDSATGYPIANNLASVTIVSDRSIDGEIWSTICFYQGIDKAKVLLANHPGIEAIFITRDLQVEVTDGLMDCFSEVVNSKD
jgi:thiamine biosynthesis lipoprotein